MTQYEAESGSSRIEAGASSYEICQFGGLQAVDGAIVLNVHRLVALQQVGAFNLN